ncbi:MAG: iron-containing alcohol dehydrogenase [Myxococcota bacterium]
MDPFTLETLDTTAFGEGAVATLPQRLREHARRAFIVTDAGVRSAGVLDSVTDALIADDLEHAIFDDVDPNPSDTNVAAGVAALRSFGMEGTAIVLVGGGSVMDCGKYVAMAAPSGIDDLSLAFSPELATNDRIDFATLAPPARTSASCVPTLAVPTTSGTASETNGGGLITRSADHRKLTFSHPEVKPRAIVLDPLLTLGLPPGATAACGMDVLTHALEAYTSTAANPYADGLALHAIRLTGEWLPKAVADGRDVEARASMQIASHLAGRSFSSGPLLGLVHAMGHPVSGTYGVAHGQTLATMLPHVMRFNREVVADRYADIGLALGTARDVDAAIESIEKLSAAVGTDRRLRDLGATEAGLDQLTTDALRDMIILNTPRYPDRAEVRSLYADAF